MKSAQNSDVTIRIQHEVLRPIFSKLTANSVSRKQETYEATYPLQPRECFSPNAKHQCICMPVAGFASRVTR